jgi:hypothetical protein
MMQDIQYEQMRRRVARRMVLRALFIVHLLLFLMVTALMTQQMTSPENVVGGTIAFLTWGTFVLLHGGLAFNLFGGVIDRATRRELERETLTEKPKRTHVELGDDGELVEVVDEDYVDEKPKRVQTNRS